MTTTLINLPAPVGAPFTAARLGEMLTEAGLFRAELTRWAACEAADALLDAAKRTDAQRRIVDNAFLWRAAEFSPAEVDLLYGMAREAARIALARRTASFRAKYGIALTCGEPPPTAA